MRCMAHVTNLEAQALLRKLSAAVEDADLSPEDSPTPASPFSCISRLRSLAAKVCSSPRLASASGEFEGQCEACGIQEKAPISDGHTR